MAIRSDRLSVIFSCLGHAYMHMFTAFYFVIVLAIEIDWQMPFHELIKLWTLGALLVGLAALPAGWLGDRWSSSGMMVIFFMGLGVSGIVCGLVDSASALFVGLAAIGLFSSIYHPVGIAWLVRNAKSQGKALGINGIFGSMGVASAGLVAGTLIDLFGWRAAFFIPGVVCLVTGFALLYFVVRKEIVDGEGQRRKGDEPSRGDMLRAVIILVVTMLIMGIIFQATQAALPKVFDIRLRDIAGEGAFGIGAIIAGVYTLGGLMQLAGGYMADHYPLKPIYVGSLLFQIPVLAAVAAFSGLPLIAVAVLTVLLSTAALPAENLMLARYTPDRHRSLAYGVKFVLAFATAPLAVEMVSYVQARTGEFEWLFATLSATALAATMAGVLLPGEWRRAVPVRVPAE